MEVEALEEEVAATGTLVADGKHSVPEGVAVEELQGNKKKLSQECPTAVQDILLAHDLVSTYDELVKTVVESSSTRGPFGGWKDKEFESILEQFKGTFAEKGVKVALCKRTSSSGTFRWLEFIDVDVAGNYVPQYDVGNRSGQVIRTCYNKLKFPKGVAVEELARYGKARKKLKEQVPPYVEELLGNKGLMEVYQSLVDEMAEAGLGPMKGWDTPKLNEIALAFKPLFKKKNVDVFVSQKVEYVSHGQYGGHNETSRWLEFVDRDLQPNYVPQRDAEDRGDIAVLGSVVPCIRAAIHMEGASVRCMCALYKLSPSRPIHVNMKPSRQAEPQLSLFALPSIQLLSIFAPLELRQINRRPSSDDSTS